MSITRRELFRKAVGFVGVGAVAAVVPAALARPDQSDFKHLVDTALEVMADQPLPYVEVVDDKDYDFKILGNHRQLIVTQERMADWANNG